MTWKHLHPRPSTCVSDAKGQLRSCWNPDVPPTHESEPSRVVLDRLNQMDHWKISWSLLEQWPKLTVLLKTGGLFLLIFVLFGSSNMIFIAAVPRLTWNSPAESWFLPAGTWRPAEISRPPPGPQSCELLFKAGYNHPEPQAASGEEHKSRFPSAIP